MSKEIHEQIRREMEAGREHIARVAANQVTVKGNVKPEIEDEAASLLAPVEEPAMEKVERDGSYVEGFANIKNVKRSVRTK